MIAPVRARLFTCLVGMVCLLMAAPSAAQPSPGGPPPLRELEGWWDELPQERRELLRERLMKMRALGDNIRRRIVDEGQPPEQPEFKDREVVRRGLDKLRRLDFHTRVRVMALAREVDALRRDRPEALKAAMEAPKDKRAQRLAEEIRKARLMRMLPYLVGRTREEYAKLSPEQQLKLLERAEKEHGKRLDRWMSMLERRSPRAKELNKRADAGDEDAAAELRVIRKKLAALNMLLMSLPPEERDRLLSEIDGKSVDEMTRLVRFAARNTTRIGPGRERRGGNRPGRGERRPGNRGPDGGRPPRGERGGERPPRGEGPRGPERRDPKGE